MTFHWRKVYGLGLAVEPVNISVDDAKYVSMLHLSGKLFLGPLLVNFCFPIGSRHRLTEAGKQAASKP